MFYYKATLSHDGGTAYIKTAASCYDGAMEIICKAEGCPECAVELAEITKEQFFDIQIF